MGIVGVFLVTFVVLVIGGGIGFIMWLRTRPKKLVWYARCYQLSKGIQPYPKDKDGNIISKIALHDLRPYIEDRIERVEKEHGIISFRLQKQDISTNAVTADMVEVWGKDRKEVSVLIDGGTATLLEKGYDRITGKKIFNPIPRDRIEHIKSEIAIKKERFKDKQSLLATITPWIVAGILMLGAVASSYFQADGGVQAETLRAKSQAASDANNLQASKNFIEAARILRADINFQEKELGIKEIVDDPLIESMN